MGGVEQGQKFSVPFPAGANGYSGAAIPRSSVPVGHWKVRTYGSILPYKLNRMHGFRMVYVTASRMDCAIPCFGMHGDVL